MRIYFLGGKNILIITVVEKIDTGEGLVGGEPNQILQALNLWICEQICCNSRGRLDTHRKLEPDGRHDKLNMAISKTHDDNVTTKNYDVLLYLLDVLQNKRKILTKYSISLNVIPWSEELLINLRI